MTSSGRVRPTSNCTARKSPAWVRLFAVTAPFWPRSLRSRLSAPETSNRPARVLKAGRVSTGKAMERMSKVIGRPFDGGPLGLSVGRRNIRTRCAVTASTASRRRSSSAKRQRRSRFCPSSHTPFSSEMVRRRMVKWRQTSPSNPSTFSRPSWPSLIPLLRASISSRACGVSTP